jgi:hypothetical protein
LNIGLELPLDAQFGAFARSLGGGSRAPGDAFATSGR